MPDLASLARSRRITRLELTTQTATSIGQDVTLNDLMKVLKDNEIQGPFTLTECHKGARKLGVGAQFEVFGRRAIRQSTLNEFDGPYLSSGIPVFEDDKYPGGLKHTVEYVAIKRAKISAYGAAGGIFQLSKAQKKHQVSLQQLRDTYLEVCALCHPPLRQHPNVVGLLGWGYDRSAEDNTIFSPVLIVENAAASLHDVCHTIEIPWSAKRHLCYGITAGTQAILDCGIIHGDLKPDNVLIFASRKSLFFCTAKIADFGLALSDYENLESEAIPLGTPGWAAPELTDNSKRDPDLTRAFLPKCDMWSLGLTIWSVMTGRGDRVPLSNNTDIPKQLHYDCNSSSMPVSLANTIFQPLQCLLHRDPLIRSFPVDSLKAALYIKKWDEDIEVIQE